MRRRSQKKKRRKSSKKQQKYNKKRKEMGTINFFYDLKDTPRPKSYLKTSECQSENEVN